MAIARHYPQPRCPPSEGTDQRRTGDAGSGPAAISSTGGVRPDESGSDYLTENAAKAKDCLDDAAVNCTNLDEQGPAHETIQCTPMSKDLQASIPFIRSGSAPTPDRVESDTPRDVEDV